MGKKLSSIVVSPTRRSRWGAALNVGAAPGAAGMEGAPPRRNLDRDQLDAGANRGCGLAKGIAVVLGRVELPERRKSSPAVRAARVLDGAAGGGCVVERHPAGDEA